MSLLTNNVLIIQQKKWCLKRIFKRHIQNDFSHRMCSVTQPTEIREQVSDKYKRSYRAADMQPILREGSIASISIYGRLAQLYMRRYICTILPHARTMGRAQLLSSAGYIDISRANSCMHARRSSELTHACRWSERAACSWFHRSAQLRSIYINYYSAFWRSATRIDTATACMGL